MSNRDGDAKTVVVTGGAQGIGKGMARHFAELGWRVVIADVDREAGEETAAELAACGRVRFWPTDVSCEDSVAALLAEVGGAAGRLEALICNAGLATATGAAVHELSLADWQRVLDTNLTGVFLCVKHAVPWLRLTRGAVVTIASTRALQSEPNTEAYSASKGGVLALTHALAVSLGPDIRVNCISPGWIDVEAWRKSARRRQPSWSVADQAQHPVGRIGQPQDIAALAAFLVSSSAGFVTGQNFVVDGGMTSKMIYL